MCHLANGSSGKWQFYFSAGFKPSDFIWNQPLVLQEFWRCRVVTARVELKPVSGAPPTPWHTRMLHTAVMSSNKLPRFVRGKGWLKRTVHATTQASLAASGSVTHPQVSCISVTADRWAVWHRSLASHNANPHSNRESLLFVTFIHYSFF